MQADQQTTATKQVQGVQLHRQIELILAWDAPMTQFRSWFTMGI